MALKVLMLRKKKDGLAKQLEDLRNGSDFETREKELETAIEELNPESSEEEQKQYRMRLINWKLKNRNIKKKLKAWKRKSRILKMK